MRFVLLLAVLSLSAFAGDFAGKWTIEGEIAGHTVNMNCTVEKAADSKIAGKCQLKGSEGTETVNIAGAASAEKFNFAFTTGSGYTLEYTGTYSGDDAIKGDISVEGAAGTFTGKRAAAAAE